MIHLVAHRGNAREYPENTVEALRSAIELGLQFIEFDVHLAADRKPVVIHDDELSRTSDRQGSIFDLTAAQLNRVQVNERKRLGDRFEGVRLPLLADVVQLLAQHPSVTAFVEIKRASLKRFGTEVVTYNILQALQRVYSQCVVISFDLPAVELAKANGFTVGWVLSDYDEASRQQCERVKPEFLFCNHEKLPRDNSKVWPGPWRWALYEVDKPQLAVQLNQRGVDLIETMAVAYMAEALCATS